jgi:thiamine pyrophosphate-dependent acetolactate synthase large subunit-like protein
MGPDSTNMLTGLYDAKPDQPPVLAISGQVPSKVLGRGAFQDLDLTTVFRDVAAWTTPGSRRTRPSWRSTTTRRRSGAFNAVSVGGDAALGAWTAAPGRHVVAVTGDGGFGQYAAELTTAVKYGIPVKHVLLDNHSLGKIGKEQLAADFPVWHTSLHNPDWAAYARLCGATGIKADRRDQLDGAMTQLFAADGPALLHVEQDPELL